MILDSTRMDAYTQALRMAVQPGSVVADLGTGTGIFALLACQYGAKHVYAIEPNDAIAIAAEIATANGYADRITFFQKLSTEVELPEKVDVIVSDMRGVLPLYQQHIPTMKDARQRLLKPGGVLIPRRDRLYATPIECPELYKTFVGPWERDIYGLTMDAAREMVVSNWTNARFKTTQFLASPGIWTEIDYTSIDHPNIANTITWVVQRPGQMHGMGMWFETTLLDDVGYSSLSNEHALVYGTAFFPFRNEVSVAPGDRISVALRADLAGDDYQWTWRTSVFSPGNPHPSASFRQSTFHSEPLSLARLRRRAVSFKPGLSTHGHIAIDALQLMAEGKDMEAVARAILTLHPNHFAGLQQAFSHVAQLAERFGECE